MRKYIWILNHYAGGMLFDKGGRHYSFAKYLRRAGYEPVIFCCNAKHGQQERFYEQDDLWHEQLAEEIETPFVFVRGRTYAGNGKQRVLNMVDFYRNVQKAAKAYAKQHGKPDVIYASSVHPLTLVAGERLAKYFGVKCICEVRDLWPESIVAYSSRFTKDNPLIKLLYQGEKWIYKKADKLIFTMEGGYDYILERGWDKEIPRSKVFHINNGVDLEVFQYNRAHFQVDDADLQAADTFKVVYTGAIRHVNHLDMILDIAKRIENPRVRFLLWGDGDQLPTLIQRAKDEQIDSVVFKGRVEKKYIPYIVSHSDLNLMDMQDDNEIFRFGISPNKMFEYFAAKRPILMYRLWEKNPALEYSVGYVANDMKDLCTCVETLASGKPWGKGFSSDGFKAAIQAFSYENLTATLINLIEKA